MFGQKNPKRVAERQLNQARLDLLEVSSTLESYQSNKRTLEDRIARLEAYLGDDQDREKAADTRTVVKNLREERSLSPSAQY